MKDRMSDKEDVEKMSKWAKLYDRFLSRPGDFKIDELSEVLAHFGYNHQDDDGVAANDRVRYWNAKRDKSIYVHKPQHWDVVKKPGLADIAKSLAQDRGENVTMYDVLTYKGYVGSVEISMDDRCLYGKLLGIRDLVLYEGNTLTELENDFRQAVDLYLTDRD